LLDFACLQARWSSQQGLLSRRSHLHKPRQRPICRQCVMTRSNRQAVAKEVEVYATKTGVFNCHPFSFWLHHIA
jgi:hypothetical protein